MYLNHMKTIDTTDTAKDWCLAIEGMTDCDEKLENFWKEITCTKERTMSYHKIQYLLIGFNSSLSVSYKKHKYMEKFFECLPKLLNEDSKEIGKTLVNYGIPCVFSP